MEQSVAAAHPQVSVPVIQHASHSFLGAVRSEFHLFGVRTSAFPEPSHASVHPHRAAPIFINEVAQVCSADSTEDLLPQSLFEEPQAFPRVHPKTLTLPLSQGR